MSTPYASASAGDSARGDTLRMLEELGCGSAGFMEDFADGALVLNFTHRGRQYAMRASSKGWATWWLRENPWTSRRKSTEMAWKRRALAQGAIAVSSIIRDLVKGQMAAVECEVLSFEDTFLPHLLAPDGRTVAEIVKQDLKLLPAAK